MRGLRYALHSFTIFKALPGFTTEFSLSSFFHQLRTLLFISFVSRRRRRRRRLGTTRSEGKHRLATLSSPRVHGIIKSHDSTWRGSPTAPCASCLFGQMPRADYPVALRSRRDF